MRSYKVTISFSDRVNGEEVVHTEAIKAQDETELQQLVPKLLLTLSQTGYIGYSPDDGWRLYPGNQMANLRARLYQQVQP